MAFMQQKADMHGADPRQARLACWAGKEELVMMEMARVRWG